MSLRRLHHEQPASFAFTPANAEWARQQVAKYPEGRQASAVIPVLWRAQEQEGWVSRPMIEEVATLLEMDPIRVLEVATFYFMFQLHPVGSIAHVQVCGTTSCMICGAEDLISVCEEKIAPNPHELSSDGKFSWEEVECLGACANAPMVQIGKDYYEDLTAESFAALLDRFAAGEVPKPGPQNGRWASEPLGGRTSLLGDPLHTANASVDLALAQGDTIARITGDAPSAHASAPGLREAPAPAPVAPVPVMSATAPAAEETVPEPAAAEPAAAASEAAVEGVRPTGLLDTARPEGPDDLKRIKGVGPKLENLLHELGVFHFDQIAAWSDAEVAWVDDHLKFTGRIMRDDWIGQATALAAEKKV